MFGYLRHLSIFLFALVIIVSIIISAYIRSFSRDKALKDHIEKTNIALSQLIVDNVWNNNNEAVNLIRSQNLSEWRYNQGFIRLVTEIINFCKKLPLVKVNFYDKQGKLFLTTTDFSILGKDNKPLGLVEKKEDLLFIQNGKSFSKILENSYYNHKDNKEKVTLIKTIMPIISTSSVAKDDMDGIIEVFYDITEEHHYLEHLQIVGITLIISIFSIFYGVLYYSSAKAERIIEKQHEANIELLEAKVKAETESQEKSKFLANVSHELRTPLNAIIGFSELIKNESYGPLDNAQYKDYINDINQSGTHLLSLINDILDYSKAEAEKLQVDYINTDISKLMISCMRLIKPRAEEVKVNLIEELPRERLVMHTDPKRFKQTLLNLLSNAVKFTPEGGSITLSAWLEEGDKLIIRVTDTGIGMAEQDISRAMATFGQVDSTLSRRYEGTGLGLPLTKKIVELMGGIFKLTSEQGFGTTVTLIFPYKKSDV